MEDNLGVQSPSDFDSEAELVEKDIPSREEPTSNGPRQRGRKTNVVSSLCPLQVPCLKNKQRSYSFENGSEHNTPPKDHFNLVYLAMIMAGAGFLFPWSSYITAVDYFRFLYQDEFREVSEAIPMTYLLTTLLLATVNISFVGLLPIHGRIGYGYIMFSISLLFVPLLDIGINNCTVSTHVSYYLTILSVVVVGLGSGVQQSSYYGLSSMLPRKYTQAVMAGESAAGLVVSINRIITKSAIKSERIGAIAFFALSLVFILFCVGCQCYIRTSPFVKYHVSQCAKKRRQDTRSPALGEVALEDLSQEQDGDGDDDNREVEELPNDDSDREELIFGRKREKLSKRILNRFRTYIAVFKQIWQLIVAIFTCYFVTLLLFPGIISEIQYCDIGDWMPILLIAIFNLTDFVAKWLALAPLKWSPRALMVSSLIRLILIPLMLLCVAPSPTHPVVGHGVVGWSIVFVFILGVTNGYFGSLPLINVSLSVKNEAHRELAGTIMVCMLLLGLTLGSVVAYALTPITRIAEYHHCNLTEHHFDVCSYGNITE